MTIVENKVFDEGDESGDDDNTENVFADGDSHWQMMWVDSYCDLGLPCPTTTTIPTTE